MKTLFIQNLQIKIGVISTLALALNVQASTELPQAHHLVPHYQNKAQQLQLAKHSTWKRLLYFADNASTSKVTFDGFFLHPQGQQAPQLELDANITALLADQQGDQAFRCRFPARSEWLIQQLDIAPQQLSAVECPEFTKWFDTIKPHKTTIIFATDFMGNPSSMFGHTLLRIDPKDQKQLNLVSYAINYAATPEAKDNDFAYAWKGLTGQYPSEYSLMPYYHKVKEYGDFESRDLWEYELNLTEQQTQFLVKHIWELQKVQFPYYFISDNCSYALLGLFDLLDPNYNLQQQFNKVAVPIETLKALQKVNLIKDVVYRPSLETQLLSQAKQHDDNLAKVAHKLAHLAPEQHITQLNNYKPLDQAKILEMAYDDLYLALLSKKITSSYAQPRIRSVLQQRSQIDLPKQRLAPEQPIFNPVEGHGARLLALESGRVQHQDVLEIDYRQAYHDLLDPQAGYRFGTQLIFLQGKLQLREDEIKLENFKLMSAQSFNPINPFKNPISWGMQASWQQESVHNGEFDVNHQHGVINLNAQAGYSLADANLKHLCYAQMQGITQFGKALDDGWRVAPAPTFGCINQWSERMNSTVKIEVPFWLEQQEWNLRLNSQVQYAFDQNNAVRFNWQYQQQDSQDWQKLSLGFAHFF